MRNRDPYIGTEIAGQFRIVERIGSGGMGAVYKAEQPEMNRFVAIKILHPKYVSRPDLVARFRREARAMSHLSHPNTARVFLYGQVEDGACYIVMEYLEGVNIAQHVRAHGPFEAERAVNILVQVCGALEEAHRAGIVHRDLKPENVFLTSQGGIQDFPKVLDFGLAKVSEREMRPGSLILTQEGMVFGTPEFMSPEQAQGKTLDGRSDIYSIGVVLYEMLTGKLPFDAKAPMDYIALHINAQPMSLRERAPGKTFPPDLEGVLMQALGKKPDDRFVSAAAFANALRGALQGRVHTGAMRAVPQPIVPDSMKPQGEVSPLPKSASQAAVPQTSPPAQAPASVSAAVQAEDARRSGLAGGPLPWILLAVAALFAIGGVAALAAVLLLR